MEMRYHDCILPSDVTKCLQTKNALSAFHLNVRSLRNKVDTFDTLISHFPSQIDVFMLTETWYHDYDDMYALQGYNYFYLNSQVKRGGGVSIYVRQSIRCDILARYTEMTDDFEILTVRSNNLVFSVVYRPPSACFDKFSSFLDRYLEFISLNKLTLFLGGDFNVNTLLHSTLSSQLDNIISSNGFMNVIQSPTRINISCSSALDLFVTNISTDVHDAGTIISDISDHIPIFISCGVGASIVKSNKASYVFQNISERNLENFRVESLHTDWGRLF